MVKFSPRNCILSHLYINGIVNQLEKNLLYQQLRFRTYSVPLSLVDVNFNPDTPSERQGGHGHALV